MPRLREIQCTEALMMLAHGYSIYYVSRALGCYRNTIIRFRTRFQQTGCVADRRKSDD